jgi:hypothetical protein
MKNAAYALFGVLLILFAIPLGFMLAPLIIGGILLWVAIRRADRALEAASPGATA